MAKGAVKMSNKFPAKGQIKPIEVSVDAVTNKSINQYGEKTQSYSMPTRSTSICSQAETHLHFLVLYWVI